MRDIKKELADGGEPVTNTASLDMFRQMQAELRESMAQALTEEQAASILTQQLAQTGIFDGETMIAFKNIAQTAFEQIKKTNEGESE